MAANNRIQWLHKKITEYSYPNAMRLAERFNVSHRQAQRDVDFLRKQLGAPIEYDAEHKGFYYTTDFSLPVLLTSDNDESYMGVVSSIYNNEVVFPQSYVDLVWKTSGQLFPSFRMCGQVKNLHGLFFSYPHISLTDFFPKFQGAYGFSTNPQPLLLLLLIKLYLSHLYAC